MWPSEIKMIEEASAYTKKESLSTLDKINAEALVRKILDGANSRIGEDERKGRDLLMNAYAGLKERMDNETTPEEREQLFALYVLIKREMDKSGRIFR